VSGDKAQLIVSLFDRIRAEERLEYEQLLAAALAKDATGNLRKIEGYTRRQIAAAQSSVQVLQSLRRAAGLPAVSTKFRS
jgi:hypothetical protein